ncbi:MAG: gluconate 2-dehydrogenase subunit 3 family protein [Chloroflexota bacterium]
MTQQPEVAGPQAEASVTSQPTPTSAPPVLDAAQRALLRSVLNRIVPARLDLPGAGDLEVGDFIERTLAVSIRLRRLFLNGLREVEITTGAEREFVGLDAESQIVVLQTVEQRAAAFFVALVEHTYRGYYTLAAVQRVVGWEPRPPQPLGHSLPPFDSSLLDRQRQRAPFWRQTG